MPERDAEALLWTMLAAVESHTVGRYRGLAPELLTAQKRAATAAILGLGGAGPSLEGTALHGPVVGLLAAADGGGTRRDALLLQGVVLELLGVTIYRMFGERERLSATGAAVAAHAGRASAGVAAAAVEGLRALVPDPGERLQAFTGPSHVMFARLDVLGEALDDCFAAPFDLRFADVMGDFAAELLPACTHGLGLPRREVMVHMTSALMA